MRARGIKPGFFKNEELMECAYEARLLYIGLWCLADRRGRMEYRPKRIKFELFPGDNVDVESMVQALCKHGFIRIYSVNGTTYLDIPTFEKNQSPHKNEKDSELPPYENRDIQPVNIDSRTSTIQAPEQHGTNTVPLALTADCCLLTPDTLTPDNGDQESPRVRVASFDVFWKAYPCKKGRQDAQRWWSRNRPDEETLTAMLAGIRAQSRERNTLSSVRAFCPEWPHGSTWLSGRRWEDATRSDDEIIAEHQRGRLNGTHSNGQQPRLVRNLVTGELE